MTLQRILFEVLESAHVLIQQCSIFNLFLKMKNKVFDDVLAIQKFLEIFKIHKSYTENLFFTKLPQFERY